MPFGSLVPQGAAFGTLTPEEQGQVPPNILDRILSALVSGGMRAAMAPGQAYQSTTPVTTEQMVKPATDLAGMVTLGAGAAPSEADALRMGIKAYHGSPYDFEKFDLSKVGTGEGAQAYGHGLYFAENPQVAEAYKRALTGLNPNQLGSAKAQFAIGGVPMPTGISGHAALDTGQDMDLLLGVMKNTPDSTMIPFLKQKIENRIANHYSMTQGGSAGEDMRAMADYYNKYVKDAKPEDVTIHAPGRMYEVNINAEPHQFLDWGTPITKQHETVRQALGKLPGGEYITKSELFPQSIVPETYGGAKNLADVGIPGIRYLDQGSRTGGQGTYNYVVFNPDLVDILRKYAIPGMLGGGAAFGSLAPKGGS